MIVIFLTSSLVSIGGLGGPNGKIFKSVKIIIISKRSWKYEIQTKVPAKLTFYLYDSKGNLVHTYKEASYGTTHSGIFGGYIPTGTKGKVRIKAEDRHGNVDWWEGFVDKSKAPKPYSMPVEVDMDPRLKGKLKVEKVSVLLSEEGRVFEIEIIFRNLVEVKIKIERRYIIHCKGDIIYVHKGASYLYTTLQPKETHGVRDIVGGYWKTRPDWRNWEFTLQIILVKIGRPEDQPPLREKRLIELLTGETIERFPVTVDGQQYYILTLKSYIDPETLELTPDVLTKVYVEAVKNYPVSDPEIARKIGIIDYARQISEKIEEIQWNKQTLTNIKNSYITLRLTDLTIAAINIYVSGVEVIRDAKTVADVLSNIRTIKDFAQVKVPASWSSLLTKLAELAMRVLIYDPMKELENDLLSELSGAINSYTSALGMLEKEITEYSTAKSFLSSYLSAEAHKDQALYLFKKFLDNYKLFIVKLISGLATSGLANFPFLVKEAMDSLDWTITLTYNRIISSYENFALLNFKLLESAEYTLKLAGTPSEVIREYAIKYTEHVNEGYEEAAKAVEKIIAPMIPFFMRISIFSPVELRVYDPDGRVTGLVNGEEINEITYSIYHENTVIILSSNDSYLYEIVGTEEGSYGLEVERVSFEENKTITFLSSDIPISINATHQYTINWDALSQGKEGVTIKVDSDGDGVFELIFTSDSELTREEFKLQIPSEGIFPMWIIGVAVAMIAVISIAVAMFWRKQKTLPTKRKTKLNSSLVIQKES